GNVTGLTMQAPALSGKRLELLKEAAPQATRVAVIWNATTPAHASYLGETEAAARALGLQLHAVAVHSPADLDRAFEAIARTRPSALITLADGFGIVFAKIRNRFEIRVQFSEKPEQFDLPVCFLLQPAARADT